MQDKENFNSQTLETNTPGDPSGPDNIRNEVSSVLMGFTSLATKLGYNIVKDYRESKEPFSVSVRNSIYKLKHHFVLFELSNNTSHGLFVEKALIHLPGKRDETLSGIKNASRFVDSYWNINCKSLDELKNYPIESSEPIHILLQHPGKLCIAIPELTPRTVHEKVPYLIATFVVSHLNEQNPIETKAEFRIRWMAD